ncbi:MAG: hypothetical protein IMW90_22170 [Thermogemmatispora sp.]|jgi:hypothetical protein|uniref:Uncharacterized protein n=1 Tax=Thermogemmatispora aurantia TaxID=2045279 RepID=A0A5J4KHL3_9CHLR|nr:MULTISPECIES: hypothetical protein [Thermogemmatispora]MBE3568432.1 hypothetical protein [Thermogemmatispora sp.]GER85691.1 hypothetical protein KTAU_43250 [Thermogemmatispora aurantia]
MKYFFWIAFAVFLAASIPHVAYFFASFEPSSGPEGIWWWGVSYAIAISIDVTIYLLSWTAFQRYRRYRTPKAVWQHWLLIIICTGFSWAVNWAYAKQFHSPQMLSAAEHAAPWLTNVFPFMASAFPLLGIVYTMMAETISETEAEEKKARQQQLTALSELAKQVQLPMSTLRRALTTGSRLNPASLLPIVNQERTTEVAPVASAAGNGTVRESSQDLSRPITGQIVAVGNEGPHGEQNTNPAMLAASAEGNPDKLQMTIEVLKSNPSITDEALAQYLALKRPASARFWRLKALEILNANGNGAGQANHLKNSVSDTGVWATREVANGSLGRR